jgi:hypothetical protein
MRYAAKHHAECGSARECGVILMLGWLLLELPPPKKWQASGKQVFCGNYAMRSKSLVINWESIRIRADRFINSESSRISEKFSRTTRLVYMGWGAPGQNPAPLLSKFPKKNFFPAITWEKPTSGVHDPPGYMTRSSPPARHAQPREAEGYRTSAVMPLSGWMSTIKLRAIAQIGKISRELEKAQREIDEHGRPASQQWESGE